MPIYEFECEECGKVFEELVLGSNASNVKCKKLREPKGKETHLPGCLLNQAVNLFRRPLQGAVAAQVALVAPANRR
jgi:putative FmdB family regulatory protein